MRTAETAQVVRIWQVPLALIEKLVSAHLGPGRVCGNESGPCFSRQVSMYLARHVGGWSTTKIGRYYNGRHHTTVMHSIAKVERLRNEDEAVDALLEVLTGSLTEETLDPRAELQGMNWRNSFVDLVADRILERISVGQLKQSP